eukprot:364635-Chlamydomonas_euryale.AAC.8
MPDPHTDACDRDLGALAPTLVLLDYTSSCYNLFQPHKKCKAAESSEATPMWQLVAALAAACTQKTFSFRQTGLDGTCKSWDVATDRVSLEISGQQATLVTA